MHLQSLVHRSLITTACLVLLGGLPGCSLKSQAPADFAEVAYPELTDGPELSAAQHEQLGDDLHERRSPEMAYVHYTRALASVGHDSARAATLEVKKGLVLLSQGHDEAALKAFQKVLEEHPDHALANEAAGAVYLKAGLTREARAHFEKAASLDASLWRTQQYLGVLASREARYEDAVRYFSVSLELRPGQPGTLNNLGVAHLMQANYEEALAAFRSAMAAGAPETKTYNNIGLTLARMGRTQEALQTFGFAGDEAKAHNNLGYVLMLQGDNEQAIHHFEQAIKLSPSYYAKAFSNLKQARLAQHFHPAQHGLAAESRREQLSRMQGSELPLEESTDNGAALPAAPAASKRPEPATSLGYVPFQKTAATSPLSLGTKSSFAPETRPEPMAAHVPTMGRYGLHVASFKSARRTQTYVRQLAEKGIETMVMSVVVNNTRWNRVLAGSFATTGEAAKARPGLLAALNLTSAPILQFADCESPLPPMDNGPAVL